MKKLLVTLIVFLLLVINPGSTIGQGEAYYHVKVQFADSYMEINLPNEIPDLSKDDVLVGIRQVMFDRCFCCPDIMGVIGFIVPNNNKALQYSVIATINVERKEFLPLAIIIVRVDATSDLNTYWLYQADIPIKMGSFDEYYKKFIGCFFDKIGV